jgi:hypothetical protein
MEKLKIESVHYVASVLLACGLVPQAALARADRPATAYKCQFEVNREGDPHVLMECESPQDYTLGVTLYSNGTASASDGYDTSDGELECSRDRKGNIACSGSWQYGIDPSGKFVPYPPARILINHVYGPSSNFWAIFRRPLSGEMIHLPCKII